MTGTQGLLNQRYLCAAAGAAVYLPRHACVAVLVPANVSWHAADRSSVSGFDNSHVTQRTRNQIEQLAPSVYPLEIDSHHSQKTFRSHNRNGNRLGAILSSPELL